MNLVAALLGLALGRACFALVGVFGAIGRSRNAPRCPRIAPEVA